MNISDNVELAFWNLVLINVWENMRDCFFFFFLTVAIINIFKCKSQRLLDYVRVLSSCILLKWYILQDHWCMPMYILHTDYSAYETWVTNIFMSIRMSKVFMQYTSKSQQQQQWRQQTGSLQIIFTFTGCAVDLLFLNTESIDRLTVLNSPSPGCFSQRWVSIIYILWWKTLTKAMTTNLSLLCFFP